MTAVLLGPHEWLSGLNPCFLRDYGPQPSSHNTCQYYQYVKDGFVLGSAITQYK